MPLPIPNLDDKAFSELYEESRALIPRYAREWTDHNLSDPGATFIDLFAWLAEMQIYYLDRVTDKQFLKFLRLLGESPRPASPAAVHVTFSLAKQVAGPVNVPKGTQVAATDPVSAERIVFETAEDLLVHSGTVRRVVTRSRGHWVDDTASNTSVGDFYFAFGEEPRAGDRLYFGFDAERALPAGEVRLIVNVYDADLPAPGAGVGGEAADPVPSAELLWQYWAGRAGWKQLEVSDETVALTRSGSVRLELPTDAAAAPIQETGKRVRFATAEALYWLRASVKKSGYEIAPRLDTVAVNTVAAAHGRTVRDERTPSTGLPFQKVRLRNRPVLHRTVGLEVMERDETAYGGGPDWQEWTEVDDFDASGPEDRHFTVDLQGGFVKFGDGVNGRIPPVVKPAEADKAEAEAAEAGVPNIHVIKYRVGGGEKGNVKANLITEILARDLKDKLTVVNARAAAGGAEAEPLDEAKSRARRNLKEVTRAITTDDFETLALRTPGLRVARVKVLTQYNPKFPAIEMPGAVTVVVVPARLPGAPEGGLPVPSRGFVETVYRHLKSRAVVTTNLSVVPPDFVEVTVRASVKIDPRVGAETVRVRVADKLREFLDPLTGGGDGKGWPFGRPVYESEIYQLVEGVAGVVCVEKVSLSGGSCDSARRDRITLRKTGLVYSGEHEIVAC